MADVAAEVERGAVVGCGVTVGAIMATTKAAVASLAEAVERVVGGVEAMEARVEVLAAARAMTTLQTAEFRRSSAKCSPLALRRCEYGP